MMENLQLLTQEGQFKCKASSTLSPGSLYSVKHMFDNVNDTCWNSDQGSPQHLIFDFLKPVNPQVVVFVFQGGFVGQEAVIEIGESLTDLQKLCDIHTLQDNNDVQRFSLSNNSDRLARYLKITFPSSTDFYGRVTIYSMEIWGKQ